MVETHTATTQEGLPKSALDNIHTDYMFSGIMVNASARYPDSAPLQDLRVSMDLAGLFHATSRSTGDLHLEIDSKAELTDTEIDYFMSLYDIPTGYQPSGKFSPFVLAHNLGHIINGDLQSGPQSENPQSGLTTDRHAGTKTARVKCNKVTPDTFETELRADFVGRTIIANSEVGRSIGITEPNYPPHQWSEWVNSRSLVPDNVTLPIPIYTPHK